MQFRLSLAILAVLCLANDAWSEETTGLVKEKPTSGRFVKTDRGFMVPYKMAIPGTEIEFEMIPVAGGNLMMGSPASEPDREETEGPQFEVSVEPFWIGKHEIRWEEYKQFMNMYQVFKDFESYKIRPVNDDNKIDAITAPTELYEPDITFEFGSDPKQAAVTMTQYAAKQYTKWMTGITGNFHRLPYESEWEYACRAGTKTAYSFGNDPDVLEEYAVFEGNSDLEGQHHIGTKKPNPWGLHDMHGNVAEWVLDGMLDDGYTKFGTKSWKAADAVVWPKKESSRVVKGGSWESEAAGCRSAARLGSDDDEWKSEDPNIPLSPWWYTSDPARGVGFRLFRPLREPDRKDRAKFWDPDVEAIKFAVENRLEEGRGVLGLVDKDLPKAISDFNAKKK